MEQCVNVTTLYVLSLAIRFPTIMHGPGGDYFATMFYCLSL